MAARSPFSMCARKGSTDRVTRCSPSICPTAGSKGKSLGWCRRDPAGSFCSTTRMASRPRRRAASRGSATATSMCWPAAPPPGRPPVIGCSRAATSRARPLPRSSSTNSPHPRSPPPSWTACGARAKRVTVLDSRPVEEYARFHVPGAITCPGAELVHRFSDLVDSPETLVVVSCAGRTRGIIGAQSLINAGVPNRVVSLSGRDARLAPRRAGARERSDHGTSARSATAPTPRRAVAPRRSPPASGSAVSTTSTLGAWLGEAERADDLSARCAHARGIRLRSPAGIGLGSGRPAGAGDRSLGRDPRRAPRPRRRHRHARDHDGSLAEADWAGMSTSSIAAWRASALETDSDASPSSVPRAAPVIEAAEAARWLDEGATAVSLEPSSAYRQAHPAGAVWGIRPRLDRLPAAVLKGRSHCPVRRRRGIGQLAAIDLAELTTAQVALVRGGTQSWARAGLPMIASPDDPPDAERIDFVFWNHDRHAGNQDAMRAYLRWETELPAADRRRRAIAGFGSSRHEDRPHRRRSRSPTRRAGPATAGR